MSSSNVYGQRRSWRQKKSTGKNRWPARVLFTLLAVVLLGWFVYWLLPGPARELRVFMIHAGSYDNDLIMPPMYGATAQQRITSQLGATVFEGRTEAILGQFRETDNVRQSLRDDDDTVLLVVRGYLLTDKSGQPAIACSDLGIGPTPSEPTGLLPLAELLQPLVTETPDSFSGTRLVVLDVEPLAALPRFDQYGDRAVEAVEAVVEKLRTPHADRLWVLVTRGPMQNAGWDPQAQLPIATQTLLEGLGGQADLNQDYEILLDELCRYITARYQRLAQRSSSDPPDLMLLRGGTGRIDETREASGVWIARALPSDEPESEQAEESPQEPAAGDTEQDEPQVTAWKSAATHQVSHVSYRANQAVETDQTGDADDSGPPTQPGGDEPATTGQDTDSKETSDEETSDEETDSSEAAAVPPDAQFWDIRDRLESIDSADRLQPIAVSPHLWRKLVQVVLHADVEALDRLADASRTRLPQDAARDLITLQPVIGSPGAVMDLVDDDFETDLVKQLFSRWEHELSRRTGKRLDDQVNVADQLQLAIAVGRMRVWGRMQYDQQAIICGGKVVGSDSAFLDTLQSAEDLLASQRGDDVDVQEMRGSINDLDGSVQRFDSFVATQISKLIEDFGRTDSGNVWPVIRRTHAWLRSPLPSASQRRALMAAIGKATIQRVNRETLGELPASVSLADPQSNSSLVGQVKNDVADFLRDGRRDASRGEREQPWSFLATQVRDPKAEFADRFAASLRMDPRDTVTDDASDPILHRVVAKPRIRNPTAAVIDSSGQQLDEQLVMESLRDHLWVNVDPDSDNETAFQLTAQPAGGRGSVSDQSVIVTSWLAGSGVQTTSDPNTVRLTIPAGQSGRARLDVRTTTYADATLDGVPIEIRLAPVNPAADALVTKRLSRLEKIRIALPQRDRIRLAIRTQGLSREVISGEEDLSNGVWLRTFASRQTKFAGSLFNDSNRRCRVRIWLVRLRHPFTSERVTAYWPDLLAARLQNLRRQMLDADGRVYDSLLAGDQVLKGPTDVELEGGRQHTKVTWKAAEKPADGTAAAAPEPPPASADGAVDVSHGMALVVRVIDDSGKPTPGGDQMLWMIPKPWSPESYIQISKLEYEAGEVGVSAEIKATIDGDNLRDEIPGIDKTSVVVQWTEDDQWAEFETNSASVSFPQPLELRPGALPGQIKVRVPRSRNETVVRLDVDGWPRAIHRVISHLRGAAGRRPTRWETIQFSSVAIDFGDQVPKRRELDRPIDPVTEVYNPTQVVFPGRAKLLRTRVRADLSAQLYQSAKPPEIRLLESGQPRQKYWTDRLVRTVADDLADNGRISLTTTVDDLVETWTNEASRSDAKLDISAELQVGERKKTASLRVTLDSTPPKIDQIRPSRPGPYYVGQQLDWEAAASDVERNILKQVSSGVREIMFGEDENGDGIPDGAKATGTTSGKARESFALEKEKELRVAAIAWDAAGWASDPAGREVTVVVKPKPKPKPKPATTPGPGPAVKKGPKRGSIRGSIAVKGGMRGDLILSPAPKEIRPGSKIPVETSKRPSFNYTNVPEGQYTLIFRGYFSGTRKTYVWKGLEIDTGNLSLSLSDAEPEQE